jgi:hypothetical protein
LQIFGNDLNKYTFYAGTTEEQVEVKECLLSFGAESSVFQFAVQIYGIKIKIHRPIILLVI